MHAIIQRDGSPVEGDFKSLDGLTVLWRESDGDIPEALLAQLRGTPAPQPQEAYIALLGSALFDRIDILGDSAGNERVGRKKLEFGMALTAPVFIVAGADRALEKLNTAINEALVVGTHSLTAEERTWVETWSADHHLGLTMPWS